VIFAVPELVLKELPVVGDIPGLPYIFSGILIVVVIMFFPQGLKGLADLVRHALTPRPKALTDDAAIVPQEAVR
jgi:branched-chain amino acid transport system permease protein